MNAPNPPSFAHADAVHVWRASLDASPTQVAACESLLATDELARARRFHFERDRRRFTLARGLLRELAARYLATAPATLAFSIGPHGKPTLAGLHFNVSHSDDQALFAFSPSRAVGIDLEAGSRLGDDWPGLVRRIFSAREQTEIAALPPAQQRAAFLNGWTRKEAFLKATGQGLVHGLAQIEVCLDPARPAAFLSPDLAAQWTLHDLQSFAQIPAALVVAGPAPVAIVTFNVARDLNAPATFPAPPAH